MFDGADVKGVSILEGFNADTSSSSRSTSNVVDMEGMFHYATNAFKIAKENYKVDTDYFSSVTSMRRMFAGTDVGCLHKSSLPECLDMSEMFAETTSYNCVSGISEIEFSDVSKVTTAKGMFKNSLIDKKLAQKFPNALDFSEMYMGNTMFNKAISSSKLGGSPLVTSTRDMFRGATNFNGDNSDVHFNSLHLKDASGMFAFTKYVGSQLKISSQVLTDTSYMFEDSNYNKKFQKENVETGLVRNMDGMFKNVNIFSKTNEPKHMFGYTTTEVSPLVPNNDRFELNLTSVTSMRQTFMGMGATSLKWGSMLEFTATSSLTDISGLFQGSNINREKDVRDFMILHVPGVKDVSNMFAGANVVDKKITINSNVITDFRNMFNGFSGALSLDSTSDFYLSLPINHSIVKGSGGNIQHEGVKGMFYNTPNGITNSDLISFYNKYQDTKITTSGTSETSEAKIYDDTGIFLYYESGNNVVRENDDAKFIVEGIEVSSSTILGFDDIVYERYEALNITDNITNSYYYY